MSLTTWITDQVYMPLNIALGTWRMGHILAHFHQRSWPSERHGAKDLYPFSAYTTALFCNHSSYRQKSVFEKNILLKDKWYYRYPRHNIYSILVAFGASTIQSDNVADFFATISRLGSGFGKPFFEVISFAFGIPFLLVLIFKEFKDENKLNIHFLHSDKIAVRLVTMVLLICCIMLCGNLDGAQFIYFQF